MNGAEVIVLYTPFWVVSVKFDDGPVLHLC